MRNWEIKTLGEIANINYGYTEKASFEEIGPKFLRITDIQELGVNWDTVPYCNINESDLEKYKLKSGDIVFARTGATTGKSYLVMNPPKSVFASYLIKVNINTKGLLPDFLYAFFQTKTYWDKINEGVSGSAQGGFNATKLAELRILIPPLPEQQQIVRILDEAFAAIDKAKENLKRNLQNAKELFQSELNSIFTNKGEGWEEKKLGEVLQKTETINPLSKPNEDFIYIDVSSVNKETLLIEEINLIKGKDAPSRARKLVKTNDVIFATVRPTLKRIAIITDDYNEQICSTGYFVLRAKENIQYQLLFYYLQTFYFQEKMEKLQKGASYPAVTDGEVRNQLISYPTNIKVQQQIVHQLDALSTETKKLELKYQQKLDNLEDLKKSILEKAFRGELKN